MSEEERAGLVEGCTVQAWRSASEQVKRWTPEDRLRAALARRASEAVDRALDGWTRPQVRQTVPIRGTLPEDYRYRILSTENGKTFVTIDASNEPSLRTAKRVGRAVVMVSRFADLEPGALLD